MNRLNTKVVIEQYGTGFAVEVSVPQDYGPPYMHRSVHPDLRSLLQGFIYNFGCVDFEIVPYSEMRRLREAAKAL